MEYLWIVTENHEQVVALAPFHKKKIMIGNGWEDTITCMYPLDEKIQLNWNESAQKWGTDPPDGPYKLRYTCPVIVELENDVHLLCCSRQTICRKNGAITLAGSFKLRSQLRRMLTSHFQIIGKIRDFNWSKKEIAGMCRHRTEGFRFI